MRIFICLLLLGVMFLLYVGVENRMLIVRRYKISTDNFSSQESIKIVQSNYFCTFAALRHTQFNQNDPGPGLARMVNFKPW